MELDHIVPVAEGGSDDIENAIAVCFECHAEIHSYNDDHPRGRKFRPDELRSHKTQWLQMCTERPDLLVGASTLSDVGPLQALLDELDFNIAVLDLTYRRVGDCDFLEDQFRRAVSQGAISVLDSKLKQELQESYVVLRGINEARRRQVVPPGELLGEAQHRLLSAKKALLDFLGSEER